VDTWRPGDGNERIAISNLTYGLLKYFHKKGLSYTIPYAEGLSLDQRAFGPAVAKGLFETDSKIWYMTELGHTYVAHFEGRSAWKEHQSRSFSHYIEVRREVAALRKRKKQQGKAGLRLVARSATA